MYSLASLRSSVCCLRSLTNRATSHSATYNIRPPERMLGWSFYIRYKKGEVLITPPFIYSTKKGEALKKSLLPPPVCDVLHKATHIRY